MDEESKGGQQPIAGENETLENEIEFSDDEKALLDEETSKKVNSLFGQKKHFRSKWEKEHLAFEDYKKLHPEEKKPEETKPLKKDDEIGVLRTELQEIRLGQANPTLKADQLKKAIAYAKAEGIETQEFINSEFFQAYLGKQAEKEAASKSAPNPSNRSGSAKADFSKMTDAQLSEFATTASDEDYAKLQKFMLTKDNANPSGLRLSSSIRTS